MSTKKQVPCEIYSRVVGYYQPITQWNLGKREEFKNRRMLNVQRAISDGRKHGFKQRAEVL